MTLPIIARDLQTAAMLAKEYLEQVLSLGGDLGDFNAILDFLKQYQPPRIVLLESTIQATKILLTIQNATGGDMLKPDTICFRYSDNGPTYHSDYYQLKAGEVIEVALELDPLLINASGTILVYGVFGNDSSYWHRYTVR
jgi:hypothetical protein